MNGLEKEHDLTLLEAYVTNLQPLEELEECDYAEKLNVAEANDEISTKIRRKKLKGCTALICQICGERAFGYNFNAVSCEPCKAFFRRNALKSEPPVCSFDSRCQLDKHSRKWCSGCRLKKCFDIGMKKEWILGKFQLEKRRKMCTSSGQEKIDISQTTQTTLSDGARASPQHNIDAYQSSVSCSAQSTSSIKLGPHSVSESRSSCPSNVSKQTVEKDRREDILQPLTSEIREKMCHLQEVYMAIFATGFSEDQMKLIVESPSTNDLWNMSEILIHMVIRFVKNIPEFRCLDKSDQITLFKDGIMKVVVFQSLMLFDAVNHRWKVAGKQSNAIIFVKTTVILKQLGKTVYEEHLTVAESLKHLTKNDSTMIALMFVIMIFSPDRLHLKNMAAVKLAQDKFCHWLHMYLESIVSLKAARKLYSELMKKQMDIGGLGDKFAEMKTTLGVSSLNPLVLEVFKQRA